MGSDGPAGAEPRLVPAVWAYGTAPRHGLAPPISPGLRRYLLLRTLWLPVAFALSIPVAFGVPTVATLMWLLIPLSGAIIDRRAPFEPAEEPEQAAG